MLDVITFSNSTHFQHSIHLWSRVQSLEIYTFLREQAITENLIWNIKSWMGKGRERDCHRGMPSPDRSNWVRGSLGLKTVIFAYLPCGVGLGHEQVNSLW